jgi:hypothetical protein
MLTFKFLGATHNSENKISYVNNQELSWTFQIKKTLVSSWHLETLKKKRTPSGGKHCIGLEHFT